VADPVPANLATIEAAFFDWIAAATSLAASRILWVNQGVNRPAGVAFASLEITAIDAPGIDAQAHKYDVSGAMNQEITQIVGGQRVGTLRVQLYAGAPTGASSPRALLMQALTALRLPSRYAALTAAGVGIIEAGPVRDISGVLTLQIEPRAQLDVRFTYTDLAFEKCGYIATAPTTNTVHT
jgi:hypothetical protein